MLQSNRRLFFGIFLILIGIIILLDNLMIIPDLPDYVFSWPGIFIIIAVFNLISGNRGAALIFGSIGGIFFLERYMDIDFKTYWPVILVIIGLSIVLKRRTARGSNPVINEDFFDDLNVFGGSEKRFTSQNLKGGKITNIFGGSDIDLREARPVDGCTLEVFTMFGGCDILVPAHWKVAIDTTSVFGGFSDVRETTADKSDFTVYIKGMTIFGAGELKSSK